MHTDKAFADTLVRFGECAHTAVEIVADIRNEKERVDRLTSVIKAMARFFWFMIEFGLMRSPDGLRAYGSGLLGSFGEIEHAIVAPDVQRYPLQSEWLINQGSLSTVTSRCCSSWILSITCSRWWTYCRNRCGRGS